MGKSWNSDQRKYFKKFQKKTSKKKNWLLTDSIDPKDRKNNDRK